ncbi:MAG: 3-deoxy-D-manno-octulosonic acid transferase [Paludibacteraceae bacterium]|nr:3-deoxy-D-manno-octulosonic acid transferase [Paludibacteraceae bacterium]
MFLYFLLIRIAALLGHKKARALVKGQKSAFSFEPSAFSGCIWIHAASAGEFEQARTLIERIKDASLQDGASAYREKVVVTFFSPSGYKAHKGNELLDGVLYLPFATRRNARKFIEALQPKMAIFVKYEFWPAYIRELKKRDIPIYSISAIFRPKQYFFRWWGKGQLRVLRAFTHIFVQDESSRRLLAEHGVHNASVAGDTRFDRVKQTACAVRPASPVRLQPIAEFAEGCERVLVAGSTWPEDEALLAQLKIKNEELKIILVPHEINEAHLHFIFNLFKGRMVKYSSIENGQRKMENGIVSRRNILRHAEVMVVDTIGLLSSIYQFGQVAYVGGGFGEGIHNTIEAAVYGVPVIFGPNYQRFREAQGLIDAGAGKSVRKYNELEEAVETVFAQHEDLGAKAAEYVESELGATAKIYEQIFANGKWKIEN